MSPSVRCLCAVLALALVTSGPLAPLAAAAESDRQSGYGSRLFGDPPVPREPTPGHEVGAVFVNFFHVPGKAILCGIGTVFSGVLLLGTFGTAYHAAGRLFEEGCLGTWVITPEHLSGKIPSREPDL